MGVLQPGSGLLVMYIPAKALRDLHKFLKHRKGVIVPPKS